LNRALLAVKTPTPSRLLRASIVRPSPRLIATWAVDGRPDPSGELEKENSSAPRVCSACSTLMAPPCRCNCWYCSHDPSGTSTPARWAAHRTSSEQSNAVGFGSSRRAS
jgi:hypothetical protein